MQEAESFQAVAGLCRLLSDANRVRISGCCATARSAW